MASTLLEYLNDVHGAIVVLAEVEAIGDGLAAPTPDDAPPSTPPTDRED